MLIDALHDRLSASAAARRVVDVRVGLSYTAALLDDGRCGLAFTFREPPGLRCCVHDQAGTLAGRPAAEIAALAKSADTLSAAVGLAVLNALTEPPALDGADALDLVAIEPTDEVGMVGHFHPLVAGLRPRVKALHIFERNPLPQSGFLSADEAPAILPRCQVAIVTSTSLLNRTMDALLDACRDAREVVLVGPSTPLLPEVFAARGVTILSGVHVVDAARLLRIVSEGGGTPQFRSAIRKVSLRIAPARGEA